MRMDAYTLSHHFLGRLIGKKNIIILSKLAIIYRSCLTKAHLVDALSLSHLKASLTGVVLTMS